MNNPKHIIAALLFCCLFLSSVLNAQKKEELKAGDEAPDLFSVRAWLKGKPVKEFRKDDQMVYVLNFTGTWCPPCVKKLPHLSELQKQYAGKARFINIFIEYGDDDDSNIKRVRKLMGGLGDKIGANIVVDMPPKGRTTWGDPQLSLFIVKAGRIIYRGGSADLDPLLAKITAGKFDEAIAQREQAAFKERLEGILKAKRDGDFQSALSGINSLIAEAHPGNKSHLYYTKFEVLAGNDDKAAYALLQWILDNRVESFDWPHFVGGAFYPIAPQNRNYEIEFRAFDRTIEESETEERKAYPLMLKALTYDKLGNYQKAVEMMQQCIKAGEEYGVNEDYESLLACFTYKGQVRENAAKANARLRSEMKQIQLKHLSRWIDAVREAPNPDHALTLELIEKALGEHPSDYTTATMLRRKMSVFADMGDFGKAAEGARQTADAWKKVAADAHPSQKAEYLKNVEKYDSLAIVYRGQVAGSQIAKIELQVGDKAPALFVQEWVKGKPVTAFEDGKIYVVEFSGTWCPPCRKAIPHLTEMAKKYAAQVKTISVYNEHNDKEKPEDLGYLKKIHALVNGMGSKMDFIVAADVPQQTTQATWGITGWPSAFIIDRSGRIAWKGHPMELDPVLAQITTSSFDAKKVIQQKEDFETCLGNIRKMKKDGNYRAALQGIDSLVQTNPEMKTWLYYVKFEVLAGSDDKKAYEWLEWILDNRVAGFDWPHFVDGAFNDISPKNRNYKIELRAIDRTIEDSETKYHAAYPLSLKARTYAKMNDYKAAIEACKQAIECSKSPGGSEEASQRLENDLFTYQYKDKAQVNTKKANSWLREAIAKKQVTVDNSLINAVAETGKPGYDFALELIDKALQEIQNGISKAPYLSRKADMYAGKGDYKKAVECCQLALDISKDANNKYYTERYEKKLAELKEKAGIK